MHAPGAGWTASNLTKRSTNHGAPSYVEEDKAVCHQDHYLRQLRMNATFPEGNVIEAGKSIKVVLPQVLGMTSDAPDGCAGRVATAGFQVDYEQVPTGSIN